MLDTIYDSDAAVKKKSIRCAQLARQKSCMRDIKGFMPLLRQLLSVTYVELPANCDGATSNWRRLLQATLQGESTPGRQTQIVD